MDTQEKVKLFTSLFKGRTDVFARRWERWGTDISGYSPVYTDKEKQIADGHFQILIATGQLLGEGTSLKNIDCLFLVYPFAYEGKLIQYIGRIQHGKASVKTIYDYRDRNVEYLEKLFKKRAKYYKTLMSF